MVPTSLACYSYTLQLGKTFVISISFSFVKEISQTKLKLVDFHPPLSLLPPVFILSTNLESTFHGLMSFTYSIIHNYGSEIDLGGIFHGILSFILRSFHLWILCVSQDRASQIFLNSSPAQHYFGTLSKVFWPECC